MSKLVSLLLCFSLIICILILPVYATDTVSARHAVLLECYSDTVVYGKNERIRAPMASTTKIMTAYIAVKYGELDETVIIPKEATNIEGSSVYLKEGERLTLLELVYALMLESANDASVAIAIAVCGDEASFVNMMNSEAEKLGLTDTHFTNPHGLDNDEHYTTAYDLARLADCAMNEPLFKKIASTQRWVIPGYDGGKRVLINHNKLLRYFDGAVGIKTGFTKRSGRCLVSCAERDGVRLICVTLNAPSDWNDHKNLLSYGFGLFEGVTLAKAGAYTLSLNCVGGEKSSFLCANTDNITVTLEKGKSGKIRAVTEYDRMLCAPIKKGDKVGRIAYYIDNELIAECPLYSLENVRSIKYKKSILERIFG